jgi:hypothetical protein
MSTALVITSIVILAAAMTVMIRFRLRAWLVATTLGLFVGAIDAFRTFFLLPVDGGVPFVPAAALLLYYGALGFALGAMAEFIRYLHRLTHGRKPEKDIV